MITIGANGFLLQLVCEIFGPNFFSWHFWFLCKIVVLGHLIYLHSIKFSKGWKIMMSLGPYCNVCDWTFQKGMTKNMNLDIVTQIELRDAS
jgi:hypothetical protein